MTDNNMTREYLLRRVGEAADLTPWAYVWRADRSIQAKPEAEFLPRRIKRQDEVYRTLLPTLGKDADSICYAHQHDTMIEQLPPAKGSLLTGALWDANIADYQIDLVWPEGAELPSEEEVEVRIYPTAWGWFGFSIDRNLIRSDAAGNVWHYPCLKGLTMDYAYNTRSEAAISAVAVFAPEGTPVPELRITGGSIGTWKVLTFTVEWGFDEALPPFEGDLACYLAEAVIEELNPEEKRAKITCLYTVESAYGIDSKLTCITDREELLGATVLLRELAKHPICVPEAGLFFCSADTPMRAADYMAAAKKEDKQSVRERVRAHREAESWDELMRNIRLWRCPDGTTLPPFPDTAAGSTSIHVPDDRWQSMYELAVDQLKGPHMWGFLAFEVARTSLACELLGLYEEADRIYDYFLASPGVKPDADFSTGEGSLEWAKAMRHDMGYAHEGTDYSTGRLLQSMMYRYYLTEDRAWLDERLPRLKKAADWMIGELRGYMKEIPNREDLHCFGLIPPGQISDYALPASDRRWYYFDNAFNQMGLSAFADVLTKIGDPDAAHYTEEAKIYEHDLLAAAKREALYAPVREARDGMSRSFIPRMAYAGGLLYFDKEANIPNYNNGILDLFMGALPLGEIGGVFDPLDRRIVGTLDGMEERGFGFSIATLEKLDHPTATEEEKLARDAADAIVYKRSASAPVPGDDLWFWNNFADLPKVSHNANLYLRQDDIPNFLRFFFNHAIVMVGSNGKLWEHAHPDIYEACEHPDNGTSAWFAENFRNMLLTEDRDILWLMKGTPRAWLKQGKKISVTDMPTFYGGLTYEAMSNVDEGFITVVIEVPTRREIPQMKLRLRHPDALRIQSVKVNGTPYGNIDADGETITFTSPASRLEVTAYYR
ncbi:MAG: hypothetical protein IJA85_08770 [Clostridia bacterium]|nr:hypothetical protein [Clostridia bacterium]